MIGHFDVIAEHSGVGLWALLANGLQGRIDILGVTDPLGFEPGDVLLDLALLAVNAFQGLLAFGHQAVEPQCQRGLFITAEQAAGRMQLLGQTVVQLLLGAYPVETVFQRRQIDPVPGQQLVEIGQLIAVAGQQLDAVVTPVAAG